MSSELGAPPEGEAPVPSGGGMALDGGAAGNGGLGLAGEEVYSGMLKKKKDQKNWQVRWCTILNDADEGARFVYKKTAEDKKVKGVLALRGAWITIPDGASLSFQSACRSTHLLTLASHAHPPPVPPG